MSQACYACHTNQSYRDPNCPGVVNCRTHDYSNTNLCNRNAQRILLEKTVDEVKKECMLKALKSEDELRRKLVGDHLTILAKKDDQHQQDLADKATTIDELKATIAEQEAKIAQLEFAKVFVTLVLNEVEKE